MFDWLTTRAVANELRAKILGGRVQAILPLEELAVGFEIYAQHTRHYLFVSAEANDARVHLVGEKLRASPLPPSPFVLLLRKYLDGALVNRLEQPASERILEIEFDHHELGVTTLVVEVMGRHSNLLLLDAGRVILDAIKHVSPEQSRARPIRPKQIYQPPPPQKKIQPEQLTVAHLPATAVAEWLTRNVAGVSPLLANEIVHRAGGLFGKLSYVLNELIAAPPAPTLAYANGEIVACAPYPLTQFSETRAVDSMSAALEMYYGRAESYAVVKEPLRETLNAAREKLERKRDSLKRQLVSADEIERLKTNGELILAFAHEIKKGQRELRADVGDGAAHKIRLDEKLSAVANAQKYFADYQRAKSAAEKLPAEIEKVENELAYADQLLADVEMAEARGEIEEVRRAAAEAGLIRTARAKAKSSAPTSAPREFVSRDGFKILVGRNAKQNDALTFRLAASDDVWLHARGVGGSHVVIRAEGREVPPTTIEDAASLAAYYSQARTNSQVDVTYALRKNVRKPSSVKTHGGKPRSAPPGLVTIRDEKTVRVQPSGTTREGEKSK